MIEGIVRHATKGADRPYRRKSCTGKAFLEKSASGKPYRKKIAKK